MKTAQLQLLEALGSGVRPFDAAPPGEIIADADFAPLLDGARRGAPRMNLGLSFAPPVSGRFTLEQQHEIARGVDDAAMAGVEQALILHERQTLRVDVRNRIVLDARPVSDDTAITGIDGFVSLAREIDPDQEEQSAPAPAGAPVPARVVRNATLLHALAGKATPI